MYYFYFRKLCTATDEHSSMLQSLAQALHCTEHRYLPVNPPTYLNVDKRFKYSNIATRGDRVHMMNPVAASEKLH